MNMAVAAAHIRAAVPLLAFSAPPQSLFTDLFRHVPSGVWGAALEGCIPPPRPSRQSACPSLHQSLTAPP